MTNNDSWVNMDDDAFEAALENDTVESTVEPETEAPDDFTEELDESLDTEPETSEDAPEEELEDSTDEETDEVDPEEETEPDAEDESEEEPDTSEQPEPETDDQLKELFKPFKASGREVQVKSVEEIQQLMKMGVDYSNKLQGFKAHRKTIKMLENNEIDESKLNYFIDLSKGNPQAIAQLLKEHNVDPMEMDLEEDSSYKPSDYSVSDSAVELDDVISRIQETTSFSTTSDIVTNQWDQASKQAMFADPTLLENLNTHVANGTYERVMQEVDRARLFGGLQGLSDLEAYNQVGQTLQQQGQLAQPKPAPVVTTKPAKAVNTNKDRKLRASSSKPSRKTQAAPTNWAAMSDAEFEKLLNGD